MKVSINKCETIGNIAEFVGLGVDKEGDIWLIDEFSAFCFEGANVWSLSDRADLVMYGPFTKFTGSLTISN